MNALSLHPALDLPAVAIIGPTASGKSALGLWLAEQGYPIEIISLDSALVFRHMDIGTAKPTPAELALVPHHLVDIIDPDQTFSVADFLAHTHHLIQDIRARGKAPVILGGTLMYFKALISGMDDLPPADPAIRADIEAMAAEYGWPHVHGVLAEVDPQSAERLKPNDSQRLQRALEVYRITGKPLSAFHQREQQPVLQFPVLALEPDDRSQLHRRIQTRFEQMLNQGLIDEVQALRQRFVLDVSMPSVRCVGYRQVWSYLDGEVGYGQLVAQGVAATRQLAKRQITWLRSTQHKAVVDPFQANWLNQAKPWLDAAVTRVLQG